MDFRFHFFAALATAPMHVAVRCDRNIAVHMSFRRPQLKAAGNAQLVIPILSVSIGAVGYDIGYSGTGSASSPVPGLIGVVDILMCGCTTAAVATDVADLVAIRSVDVVMDLSLHAASCTQLPMLLLIELLVSVGLMSFFQNVTAGFAGFQTAAGEGVFLVANPSAAIGAAGPMVEIVVLPVAVQGVAGCGLQITYTAYFLVFILADVGKVAVCMPTGCVKLLCCLRTAIGTDTLTAAFFNTSGFFDKLSVFPVMGLGLCKFAFRTDTGMATGIRLFPLAEFVVAGILDTGLATVAYNLVSGVGFLIAFIAELIFLVRMVGFNTDGVVMVTAGAYGTAAGIVRGTEVEVADLSFPDHDAGSIIAGGAGVAFDGIEICTLSVVHKANMVKALLEEQITLLGNVAAAIFVG